jgi:diacylglycerol kinase family enzyme
VGTLNDKYFFAVAGVGLDASIGLQFQSHHTRGALPYFYLGIKSFFEYDYPGFKITSKEKTLSVRPTLITIANATQFGNGALIAPHADLQDGKLDICILEKMRISQALSSLMRLFNGKIQQVKSYSTFKTDYLEIISETNDLIYHVDGEPHKTKDKIRAGILKKSLNVICPEQDEYYV